MPSELVSTGWPAVRDKCLELGIRFDPWQDGVGRIILAKREDGSYATSVGGAVISIPRQVGKTFLFGALVFALCLLNPGMTVIWTAHRLRTAAETFGAMQGLARRKKIAPHIAKVVLGSGDEEIQFRNGSRVLFGARERGFGRGFAMVDVLVFDEAQILTDNAIDDMVPATNQAPNPLLLFSGTPPKPTDPGEVFTAKRAKALSGASVDMAYVEFSADEDADPDDRKQWAKANPSYPKRTPAQAVMRMRENLTDDSFMREALGLWDPEEANAVIDLGLWRELGDRTSAVSDPVCFSVAVSPDRAFASIGVAGRRNDDLRHIEVVDRQRGTAWVPDRLVKLTGKWKCGPVLLDASGPAGALLPELAAKKITAEPVSTREMSQACGSLFDHVVERRLRHLAQPELDAAVASAQKKAVGDAWVWRRKGAVEDISPLEAVTLAVFGADRQASKQRSGRAAFF